MSKRLDGKRVVVTDATEFMGPDVVALFREEGATVVADTTDLRVPGRCEALIAEAGKVDVLIANLAGGTTRIGVLDTDDHEMEDLYARMVLPLHRLTRAVLALMAPSAKALCICRQILEIGF